MSGLIENENYWYVWGKYLNSTIQITDYNWECWSFSETHILSESWVGLDGVIPSIRPACYVIRLKIVSIPFPGLETNREYSVAILLPCGTWYMRLI